MNTTNDQFSCILGNKLKEARLASGQTIEEVSAKTNLNKKNIAKVETGIAPIEDDIIQTLTSLYGLNYDSLLFDTTQESRKHTCERSSFYERLNIIMEYRSISPTQLSMASGINILELDAYLSNTIRLPKTAHLYQLSKALDVAPGWLMGYALSIHPEPVTASDYSDIVIDHGIKIVYPQAEELGLLMAYWQAMGDRERRQLKTYAEHLLDHIQDEA